jgi:hypothetical protein
VNTVFQKEKYEYGSSFVELDMEWFESESGFRFVPELVDTEKRASSPA